MPGMGNVEMTFDLIREIKKIYEMPGMGNVEMTFDLMRLLTPRHVALKYELIYSDKILSKYHHHR